MKLIIDIPKKTFEDLRQGVFITVGETFAKRLIKYIKNGIPLPKGHGRLIDADRTLATAWTNFYKHEDEWEKKDNDYLPIGRFYDQNGFECCQQTIVNAPTIIEADKAESEDKE